MLRNLILCATCLAVGAAAAVLIENGPGERQSLAQQPPPAAKFDVRRPADRADDPAASPGAAATVPGFVPGNRLDELMPDERVNIDVYERTNHSVANITTRAQHDDPFFLLEVPPTEGAGSGFVIDRQGHVLTNYHVVEGADEIRVTLFDGKAYTAEVVGRDASTDMALIRIDAPEDVLFPVTFGDSSQLRVGQRVFAIGNPFGLERTLTAGIIASLNRSLPSRNRRTIKSIIQIDASINPGNSGGPLLDTRGRVIGMNTAIASKTGQSSGVGFAIGSSTIATILPQLIEHGRVIRPDVGIARVLESDQGLVVVAVTPNGPAASAGLRGYRIVRERRQRGAFIEEWQRLDRSQADTIVAVDGKPVQSASQFMSLIESHKPGDPVEVTVQRDNRPAKIRVELGVSDE
ncbi:MAG: trypsin-like peptidase domain-containing protein [Pirellulales bacterium]